MHPTEPTYPTASQQFGLYLQRQKSFFIFKPVLLSLALLASIASFAQTPAPVPAAYTLATPADYDQYAPQVVETVNWLEKSNLPTGSEQRVQANQFLMKWLTGSPTVSVQIQEYLGSLYGKDPDLLMAFMGGWARYAIQHPGTKDQVLLNTEGLKAMLTSYQAKGGKGNKKLDELAKVSAKDQLPAWVKAHLKA